MMAKPKKQKTKKPHRPVLFVRIIDAVCEQCGGDAVLIEANLEIYGNPICKWCHIIAPAVGAPKLNKPKRKGSADG